MREAEISPKFELFFWNIRQCQFASAGLRESPQPAARIDFVDEKVHVERESAGACAEPLERGSGIQDLEGLPRVGGAQDQQPFFGFGRSCAVAILNIYTCFRQPVSEAGERSWFVISLDHQDLGLDYQRPMLLEEQQRFARVADDHPNNAMIDRVARRDGINIDFGCPQCITNPGQRSGTIIEEESKLSGDLHKRLSGCV